MRRSTIWFGVILVVYIFLVACNTVSNEEEIAASVEAQSAVIQTKTAEAVPTETRVPTKTATQTAEAVPAETHIPTKTPTQTDIELTPDDYIIRGYVHYRNGDLDLAIADFRAVLRISNDDNIRQLAEEQLELLGETP